MTIGRRDVDPPSPQGGDCADAHPGCAEVHSGPTETILDDDPVGSVSADRTSTDDDRQAGLIGLTGRILTSWPNTARTLLTLVVLIGMVAATLWLVPMAIEFGPLRITPY